MRIERWKQICIETFDGQVIAIEHQRYPIEAQNRDILYLRDKVGWWWINDWQGWAKTNNNEVMRVRIFCKYHEQWHDRLWKKITKNWVHSFK